MDWCGTLVCTQQQLSDFRSEFKKNEPERRSGLKQEAQLMLTNLRDAFRRQSRSPNMIPFRSGFLLVCYSNCPQDINIQLQKNVVTLKSWSEVTQGHRNRHGSICHLQLPINVTNNHWPMSYRFRD